MRFRPPSLSTRSEFDSLRSDGTITTGVALGREWRAESPVSVHALAADETLDWAAALNCALDLRAGVVGVTGPDLAAAAQLGSRLAVWLGERGGTLVLVDGCVEEPVLGKPLPEDPDEGLVDAVLYGVSPQRVLRRTLAPGVGVVTAGSHPISVDDVFRDDGYERTLRLLAGEGLALVVLPPAHLAAAASSVDVVLCVASDGRDLDSLSDAAGDRRTVAVLVGEPASEEERLAAVEGELKVIEPEEPAEPQEPEETQEPSAEEEPYVRHEPMRAGGASGRGSRRRAGTGLLTALIVLIAAGAVWWGLDGRSRFTGGPSGTTTPAEEVVDASGSETEPVVTPTETPDDVPTDVPADTSADAATVETEPPDTTEDEPVVTRETPADGERIGGPGGRYLVMISSHRRESDAGIETRQLSGRGVDAEVVATEVGDRGTWYRVVVSGGYPSHSMALEVLDTVKSLGYEGAWIERAAANQ